MNRKKSEELFSRATAVIPGGVNSPVRAFRSVGGTPIFMESGEGYRVKDVDGNIYDDYCNSWGPLITGHRHPQILEAIGKQVERALTFGTPCEEEVLLAEYMVQNLRSLVRTIEKVRFVNSGTEAVMSALRLARGFTGRSKVIKFDGCYHGHSDTLLVKAGSGLATAGIPDSAGVPSPFTGETIVLPLGDAAAVESAFKNYPDQIAAIIIEGVPANNGLLIQTKDYVTFLREITQKHGALLILDEVITGFRLSFGGAAFHYGIEPDLVTYGKIIGGGMPVGAFAGRSEIFKHLAPDGAVYQAGTLSGNPVAMAAGLAQLMLLNDDLYAHMDRLSTDLANRVNNASLKWKMAKIASIFWLYRGSEAPVQADQIERDAMKEYAGLHAYALSRGIYLAPSGYEVGFISSPMTEVAVNRLGECIVEYFSKDPKGA